jgi:eukaryotic-like serine/threonine-protein kinase
VALAAEPPQVHTPGDFPHTANRQTNGFMHKLEQLIIQVHRRSLWQVLSIYLVGSWIGYQVINELTQGLGLPGWVPGFAVVLFIIGLPIVLATAFVQEGMPRGSSARPRGRRRRDAPPPGPASAPPSAAPLPRSAPVHALLTWRRSILAGIVAFLLLGLTAGTYMGLRNAGIGPFGSLVAAGVLDARERVLLADFQVSGADPTLAVAVTQAFRVDFAQSNVVTLVDPAHVRDVLQRMEREGEPLTQTLAGEMALRDGIKAVLAGEIAQAGGRFILSVSLIATETGTTLASLRETANDESLIIPAVDRLSKKLRERIGESLRSIRANPPLEAVTTPSLEALRKYSQGAHAYDVQRNIELSITLLNEALEIDPGFAMAWRKLAAAYSMAFAGVEPIVRAATRAYEHRDRLTERERYQAEAFYHMNVTRDRPRAIAAYEALLHRYPEQRAAYNNLGILYLEEKRYADAAAAYEQAIAADSTVSQPYINLPGPYVALGRYDEAERIIEAYTRRFGDDADAAALRAVLASSRGDYAAAEAHAHRILELQRGSLLWSFRVSLGLSELAAVRGRLAEAERHGAQARSTNSARGVTVSPLFSALAFAGRDLFVRRDAERAVRQLDDALAHTPFEQVPLLDRPYLQLAGSYAAAGRVDRARAMLAEHDRLVAPLGVGDARSDRHAASGWIALAQGRHEDAIRELRRADELATCVLCMLPALARAYDAAGQADSAIAVYQRYIDGPAFHRIGVDAVQLGPAYERLYQLHDERGDSDRAALYAARLTELWQDADAELQPRVHAARQLLQQLSGERSSRR